MTNLLDQVSYDTSRLGFKQTGRCLFQDQSQFVWSLPKLLVYKVACRVTKKDIRRTDSEVKGRAGLMLFSTCKHAPMLWATILPHSNCALHQISTR